MSSADAQNSIYSSQWSRRSQRLTVLLVVPISHLASLYAPEIKPASGDDNKVPDPPCAGNAAITAMLAEKQEGGLTQAISLVPHVSALTVRSS
jgi:hypothetical protein